MKRLLMIAILAVGMTATAQDRPVREKQKLTAEQRNELQVRKMTLELDLTPAQQKEMAKLLADQSAKRQKNAAIKKPATGSELTADQKFERRKAMLDQRIATKARMKQILSPEQFQKWESNRDGKMAKREKRMKMRHHGKKMERK